MKPILEVNHLGKKFRIRHLSSGYLSLRERIHSALKFNDSTLEDFWALHDISFNVEPGESIGIIGRNGAGKSTLLKILSKITPPTKGRIISRGRMASLLEVGTGFHPELTGRENIFFNGSLLGMKNKEIAAKFDEIVDFSGVEKFLDTPLKHYSSGMQLRLAFSVAAFLEPEILIIDEVLAVGDAEFQKKCLGKMENVSKSGRTILFVSHNMGAIKNLCNKCMLLQNGAMDFYGDVESASARYLFPVTETSVIPKPAGAPLWIEKITINNKNADAVLYYGERIVIKVSCRANSMTKAFLGFIVSTLDGVTLLNANNRYQKNDILLGPDELTTINCELGMVPLMEGKYTLSTYLGDESGDTHILENALVFEVYERDIWGKGKTPPKKASALWWNTDFTILK